MGKPTNRREEYLRSLGKIKQTVIAGSFQPNGTSAPASVRGFAAVNRSDTGIFQVALPGNCGFPTEGILARTLTAEFATKGGNGTAGLKVEWGSMSVTAGTFDIRLMNDGTTTLVDLSGAAGDRINFVIVAANTGVTR